jgi:hypothetical protein
VFFRTDRRAKNAHAEVAGSIALRQFKTKKSARTRKRGHADTLTGTGSGSMSSRVTAPSVKSRTAFMFAVLGLLVHLLLGA